MNLSLGERPVNWPVRTTNGAVGGEVAFPTLHGVLQQLRHAQVPVGRVQVPQPVLFQAPGAGLGGATAVLWSVDIFRQTPVSTLS